MTKEEIREKLLETMAPMVSAKFRKKYHWDENDDIIWDEEVLQRLKTPGSSKAGGNPDLPKNFVWPTFTETVDDEPENLPFIAQINLADVANLDPTGLLPKTGYLYFFFTARHGYEVRHKGCAAVYYYDVPAEELIATESPKENELEGFGGLLVDRSIQEHVMDFQRMNSLPNDEPCYKLLDLAGLSWEERERIRDLAIEVFAEEAKKLYHDHYGTQLFGHPDYLQYSEVDRCEKFYIEIYGEAEALKDDDEWLLLFQFGKSTNVQHLYFFIRKSDLIARRFDRVWATVQWC